MSYIRISDQDIFLAPVGNQWYSLKQYSGELMSLAMRQEYSLYL